jgi:subtilisin family serine protease
MWDASPDAQITSDDEIRGILAAAAAGPTVINLSLGSDSRDPLEQQAVLRAFGEGSLIVAASGNSREEGNPLEYPAVLPHVLTAAATTENDVSASFSSSSPAVDLAAPGVDMPIAVPTSFDPSGFSEADGTSFAAPLVSGAAAWVANQRSVTNVTQLFQLMRGSAKDIEAPGYDTNTGFGLLSVPNALAAPIPPADPQEPNDDIPSVRASGLFKTAKPPLTTAKRRSTTIRATEDYTEDPEDVYRVTVPPHRTFTATMVPSANLTMTLWGPRTKTVFERGAALKRDLLRSSAHPGKATEKVVYTNKLNAAQTYYVDVWIGNGLTLRNVSYSLHVSWR